jgi:hypothetical protein
MIVSGAGSIEADPLKSTEITVVRCRVVDKIADMEVNWDMGELTDVCSTFDILSFAYHICVMYPYMVLLFTIDSTLL